jgi:hypothetical protein
MADHTAYKYTTEDVARLAHTALAAVRVLDLLGGEEAVSGTANGHMDLLSLVGGELEYACMPFAEVLADNGHALCRYVEKC